MGSPGNIEVKQIKFRPTLKGRMVDPKARAEVRARIGEGEAALPRRRDLLIEHLHRIQDHYGHLSAAHLAALAEELRDAARLQHGIASRAFLARLANDRAVNGAELRETLEVIRAAFIAEHVPAGAAGQIRSVAGRFALIGAAGELARDYGVLQWPEGEALRAAGACFASWLAERGGTGSGEDAAALAQVRAFLEAHGESRFTILMTHKPGGDPTAPDVARTINRAGFRRRTGDGDAERWEYLILPEAWKSEVCKGLDARRTAELLASRGLLLGGTERHRAVVQRIPSEGSRRVYAVSGAILGDESKEGATDGTR